MADHDRALGQALRPRRAHVVVVDHLEDRRPRVARDQAHVERRQHERGEDQVVERVPGEGKLAVEDSVDRVEARDLSGRRRPRVEAAPAGEPVEAEEEDVEREQREPEGRHRDPRQ